MIDDLKYQPNDVAIMTTAKEMAVAPALSLDSHLATLWISVTGKHRACHIARILSSVPSAVDEEDQMEGERGWNAGKILTKVGQKG